ncbi:MAG: hypothetical protein JJ979_08475 [Roseibium sp.]|nr:hypothetical protein [Roseibium sp.]
MKFDTNIFAAAFEAVRNSWKFFFGIIAILFLLDAFNMFYDLGNSITVAKGFAESGIVFYACVVLLGFTMEEPDLNKKYTGFMFRYLLLLYAPVIVVSLLIAMLSNSAFQGDQEARNAFLGLVVVVSAITYFLTMFLFGTLFPALVLGIRKGIGSAVTRSFRQAGYMIPRLVLGVGLFNVIPFAVLIIAENIGVGSDPLTATGAPDLAGACVLALVKLTSGFSLVIFAVIVCRAYLRDLSNLGELPTSDAEVFA